MPTNPTQQWIPPDIQAQMLEQQKKQLMAQAMLGAVQPTQPQMVGGRYIGGGLLGAATPMAKALIGAKQGEQQLQSQAEMIRAMAGKWGAGNPAELYKSGKYTPESVTEYAQSGDSSKLKLDQYDTTGQYTGNFGQDPISGTKWAEVRYRDGKLGNKPVGGQSINVNTGSNALDKTDYGNVANTMMKVSEEANKAASAMPFLQKAKGLVAGDDIINGPLADVEAWARGAYSQITGNKDNKLVSSQEYLQLMAQQLNGINKEIGGPQMSDADREISMMVSGTDLKLQMASMQRAINMLETRVKNKISLANQLNEKYGGKNGEFWRTMANPSMLEVPISPDVQQQPKSDKPPLADVAVPVTSKEAQDAAKAAQAEWDRIYSGLKGK